jgi:hypothetical protein
MNDFSERSKPRPNKCFDYVVLEDELRYYLNQHAFNKDLVYSTNELVF